MTASAFRPERELEIPERASVARSFTHQATGAQVLALSNGDANKCFGITFRAETPDDTGVGHILEHSVLCGSRRYTSAAPFAELLKGSLQTHLNASTLPDRTIYMAASQNRADFYNLFDVYFDAVFHPLLRESTFRQERGVVYNEMKGVYADPAARLVRELRAALFPDTFYRFDHGGDPAAIRELTLEAMRRFHAQYYHPANALVFLSGDLDVAEALAFLDQRLAGFGPRSPAERPPLQPPVPQPRRRAMAGLSGHVMRGWVLPPPGDAVEALEQDFLSELLSGWEAALLQNAIRKAGLSGRVMTGLSRETLQPVLSIGLIGTEPKQVVRFDEVIDGALSELKPNLVDTALHRLEFRLRENDGGRLPPELALMHRVLGPWRAGFDSIEFLIFDQPLRTLSQRITSGEYLRDRIRTLITHNPHQATVVLDPRPSSAPKAKLQEPLPSNSEAETSSSVPILSLDQIPHEEAIIPQEIVQQSDPCILVHPQPTNGICYLQIGFPLDHLPLSLLPLAPLFGRMLLEGSESIRHRKNRLLGNASVETHVLAGGGTWLFLRLGGMQAKLSAILGLVTDMLAAPLLADRDRFAELLSDEIARHQASLLPRGHEYADLAVSAALHEAGAMAEMLQGHSQLQFLQDLRNSEWENVQNNLEQLRRALIQRKGMVCSVTVEPHFAEASGAAVARSLRHLPDGDAVEPMAVSTRRNSTGVPIDAPANFVALGINLPEDERRGAFAAAARHIAGTWLWNRVRMEGGAYGALARFAPLSGSLRFLSYRDPHLLRTVDTFSAVPDFLREPITDKELRQSIISAVAELDRPKLPRDRSLAATFSHLAGDLPERRQERRECLLSATMADLHQLAALIEAQPQHVAVLGSQAALQAALEERPGLFRTDWLPACRP